MFRHYIAGNLVEGTGPEVRITNPATGEFVGSFRAAEEGVAREALRAAQQGFAAWSKLSIGARAAHIARLKDAILAHETEVVDLLMAETGKPLSGASYDFGMLIQCLGYYPEEARRITGKIIEDEDGGFRNLIIHQPLGVVVGYLAWNFPLLNVGYKLGPSLASGCTCILKPSNKTPLATLKIGEIASKIDFPGGVFNILAGSHNAISPVLSGSNITRMITLIGSSRAGREIIRESAGSIKKYSLELGGNAPAIVLGDADVEGAACALTDLKCGNAGQICVNVNRAFIHASVHDAFVECVKARMEGIKLGWGREPGAMMGPMISREEQRRMGELVADALQKGAKLVTGGRVPEGMPGNYFLPTLLDNVTRDMRVYKEEIFGPILPVMAFTDADDIVAMANDTEYGLASYLFTNDYRAVFRIAESLEFGTVCVNEPFFAVNVPHGGVKESGVGKDCSVYSLEEYYSVKRISMKLK